MYNKNQIQRALENHDLEYSLTLKISGTENSTKYLNIKPETARFLAENLQDDGTLKPKNLGTFSNDDLIKELENRGFYTRNMFSVDDVRQKLDDLNEDNNTKFSISDSECLAILDSVFDNVQSINEDIHRELENKLTPEE